MNVLKRYTKSVDGTIPVPALVYEDEDCLASQDNVGIYDGTQKSPNHQSGTVSITTHRLFYIDGSHPRSRSFALDLSHISRTEYYAGLLRSSPKVTLHLNPLPPRTVITGPSATEDTSDNSWECTVCSYRNPPGLSPAASKVCGLCGVPRALAPGSDSIPSVSRNALTAPRHHLSSSLPSSSLNLSRSTASSPPSGTDARESQEVACPACTFLNHPSLSTCEICGTTMPRPRTQSVAKSAPASRPGSPSAGEDDEYGIWDENDDGPKLIKVSFRKGGDKPLYAVLKRSLLGKGWEAKRIGHRDSSPVATGQPRSGIHGILRTVETTAATAQTDMEDALQDLEALMIKAKEMVRQAEELNERLTVASAATTNSSILSASSAVEPEEATFIRSSLSQLGLQMTNAPVTLDMIQDERKWIEELAKELARVLQGQDAGKGMMKDRGILGLDEVWGGWNRARGVALIPPSTFLQVLPQLATYTMPPVRVRTFPSGLSVLHTPPYTRVAFAARMAETINLVGPKTTTDLAREENLPIGLVQEMVAEVEEDGEVCREDVGGTLGTYESAEVRWWINVFRGYVWDGQED